MPKAKISSARRQKASITILVFRTLLCVLFVSLFKKSAQENRGFKISSILIKKTKLYLIFIIKLKNNHYF